MAKYDKADIERRMKGAVESLKSDLGGLRTGRANTSLLDPVVCEVYGAMMPLNQVATVSAPEPRMLSVQVWDKSNLTAVEKGIAKANLGLNPMIDGQTLRLPLPDLTEERRKELAKLAGEYGEKAKIAIRNVRRDGMEIGSQAVYDPIGPADGLVTYVREHPSSVLVVGTAAPKGLERLAKGSTAAAIVRSSAAPVLVVPTRVRSSTTSAHRRQRATSAPVR